MTTFAIATDNNITAFTAAEQVPEGQDRFATEKEFAKLSSDWPLTRFPEVWNAVQDAVDRWIKQGGLKGCLTDDEARRIVDEIEF